MRLFNAFVLLTLVLAELTLMEAKAQTPSPTTSPNSSLVLSHEGVGADVDKKRREPILSVRVAAGPTSATIFADAYVVSDQTNYLPIQFDFFINRAFFASQIRSTELPGPVGVTVAYKDVPLPFNYSVVAKILHPNRTFTTVLNGAVEKIDPTPGPTSTPASSLSCTYTEKIDNEVSTYTAVQVTFAETDSKLTSSFEAVNSEDPEDKLSLEIDTTKNDTDLSGTINVVDSQEINVRGSYQKSANIISSISLSSEDSLNELSCR
ncbi:MAG: hypothetical protein GYA55_13395 [SAR324 cluster bacterium]|uniref:Uncharacterized protein n=1 Tax=SAR324 cluster bacterium TaxID=2024889 RepID=A0A7X9IKJ4_9DELT|nr:hypothetical protein [SAR324 cluster bacterium]